MLKSSGGSLNVVYKIPYRRARAWPLGRVRARAKVSCIQRSMLTGGRGKICQNLADVICERSLNFSLTIHSSEV